MNTEKLFSYGTLYKKSVQLALFNRELNGCSDQLPAFQLSEHVIDNDAVVSTSGEAIHPIAQYTGNQDDYIDGHVFDVSMDEIVQADQYEVVQYKRVSAILKSGITAWVYVDARAAVV